MQAQKIGSKFRKNKLVSFAKELLLSVDTCAQNLPLIYDKVETYAANILKETTIRGDSWGPSLDEPYRAMMYTGLLGGSMNGGRAVEGPIWQELVRSKHKAQATDLNLPVFEQWKQQRLQQQGLVRVWVEVEGVAHLKYI